MHLSRANLSAASACEQDGPHRLEESQGHAATLPPAASAHVVALREPARPAPTDARAGPHDSAVGEGEGPLPAWQNYFFLAPNVRFTRTPDYDHAKRQASQDVDDQGGASDAAAAAEPIEPHFAPSGASVPIPAAPARMDPDAAVAAQAAKVAPAASRRPQPPAGQPATDRAAGTAAQVAAVSSRHHAEGARWSYLSDHAFFEFGMPFLAERLSRARPNDAARVSAAPATVHRPASAELRPAAAPVRQVPAQAVAPQTMSAVDVTSLYRIVEWNFGTPEVPTALVQTSAPVQSPVGIAPDETAPQAAQPAPATPAAPAPAARNVEITMPAPRAPSLPMAGKVARVLSGEGYEFPSEELLQLPPEGQGFYMSQERLEQNADLLESVLEDFGVKGEIIHVRPGPVVTLYEFEPAPGVKSSRVIGLADDIARSMSAVSARVAVVPGRNVIGIELPNETRETVYFRELICSDGFRRTSAKLALCLGKTIGGEPVIAELAKMPHLLVAGTTGSGKSVAINTMILSLLYRLKPEECRLIMVDPKMLELSVYDGIPHLLTPVVTDPKKAVTALKWAVREMEDRYRKMARLGVRNIDGYNQRAAAARDKGETVVMQVQTGFEKGTGEPLFEEQEIDLAPMPYIVVIVDEMADLMMVAGKEIEGAIQRLAQMARAAGIHLIMATQRPSVDVITGTIKANFPTRISFQVTSKIDSRTILGEQGAEQLLGQGDMLHMAGGGRIARVHGPFVSDEEVEHVVAHLKTQGRPEYLETVTADEEEEQPEADQGPVFDKGAIAAEDGDTIYEDAVKVVMRDKKCSTSYIQRRLGVGYNRAASLVERMEKEGLVGAPNHVGKREILLGKRDHAADRDDLD
nr:DNA translocase FtsK [Mesorhizobium sp. SP-1A]